jgi:hypothetical protein
MSGVCIFSAKRLSFDRDFLLLKQTLLGFHIDILKWKQGEKDER